MLLYGYFEKLIYSNNINMLAQFESFNYTVHGSNIDQRQYEINNAATRKYTFTAYTHIFNAAEPNSDT